MINTFLDNKESQKALYMAYARILDHICDALGIDKRYVVISQCGMSTVFNEVQSDLKALRMRRGFAHGISEGKTAGSLAFRLCRTPVLTMTPELADNPAAHKLYINVAVALALEMVGTNFALWPPSLIREIKYFLEKRHSNQESLGICFDTLFYSIPKTVVSTAAQNTHHP